MYKLNEQDALELTKVLNYKTINEVRFEKNGMELNIEETLHCTAFCFSDIMILAIQSTHSTFKVRIDLSKGSYYYSLSNDSLLIQDTNLLHFESYEFLF